MVATWASPVLYMWTMVEAATPRLLTLYFANPLTVAKAYQSFQDDGYVEVRRGVGMFVLAGAAERLRRAEREDFVAHQWPRIRERIDLLGLDATDLLERVDG